MAQLLPGMQFMKALAWSLIEAQHTYYQEDIFKQIPQYYPHLVVRHPDLNNFHGIKIAITVMASIYSANTCIVYLHGLGSNRTEGLTILRQLPKEISLVVFDFTGTGRSEGDYISYGNKQKEDVQSVLEYLREQYEFRNYVLWGRSMGAVSGLMHAQRYFPSDVALLVIDSPFSSFEVIARQMIKKKIQGLPQFLLDTLIQIVKYSCKEVEYNPFDIDLSKIQCRTPALFVYSESDTLIDCHHIFKIIDTYKGPYNRISISEDHNQTRSLQVCSNILKYVKQAVEDKQNRSSLRASKGIRLTLDSHHLRDASNRVNTERISVKHKPKIKRANTTYYDI